VRIIERGGSKNRPNPELMFVLALVLKSVHCQFIPADVLKSYVSLFNAHDEELYTNYIPNNESYEFLLANIPRFECPDKQLETTYYFRWWTYRKHISLTPDGFIVTEFMPNVPWAGPYNGISCAAMHHYAEGRWLNDKKFLTGYTHYWLRGQGKKAIRHYCFPVADSLYQLYLVTGNASMLDDYLNELMSNYEGWESSHYDASKGLYFQSDGAEGGEMSICGAGQSTGYRPGINSFQIADAKAIARICEIFKKPESHIYEEKAVGLLDNMTARLWDAGGGFFKVIAKTSGAVFCKTRELHGYVPWSFINMDPKYDGAWKFLMSRDHFWASYGPTTAEQCDPAFKIAYSGHECQWNGPSWPYATTVTLRGLANFLNTRGDSEFIRARDYYDLLMIYARAHTLIKDDGRVVPWIDEDQNPFTGDWIARTIMKGGLKGIKERGKDYQHSCFCDHVITGLIGIRPQEGNELMVNPLLPKEGWDYFCLEDVGYKGHKVTVLYDKKGSKYKYKVGTGMRVYVDGVVKGTRPDIDIGPVKVTL
jgi:hypothetical protein